MKIFQPHFSRAKRGFSLVLSALIFLSGCQFVAIKTPAVGGSASEVLVEDSDDEECQEATAPLLTESEPCADPSDTELVTLDDHEVLTGGVFDIVYYNQSDPQWATERYGRDTIGPYGCGPTAMAMVIASLTCDQADPVSVAQEAVKLGCWASKSGSYSSIVPKLAAAHGLTAVSLTDQTPDGLYDAILAGNVVVALMGPGHFTQKGHFILLRGVTLGGQILVADPVSRERSLTLWEPEVILEELSKHTSSGGPIWAVSASGFGDF